MDLERLTASLELKTISTQQRVISGHAAAWALDRVGDVIDTGAFTKTLAEKPPASVGVFIAHQMDLPVGVPIKLSVDATGLYCETKIFDGPVGDNLLAVARGLAAHGQSLGLSIGYRTRKSHMKRLQGKTVRVLTDVDLVEFSYASSQSIANPAALVSSVKASRGRNSKALSEGSDTGGGTLVPPDRKGGGMQCRVDQRGQQWVVLVDTDADGDADDNRVIGTYDDENTANLVAAALRTMAAGGDDDSDVGKAVRAAGERKADWSTSYVNNLEDTCFLYVEPGGTKDEENKTVPRAKRHFPYRTAPDAQPDLPHLRNAIARIPQSDAPGLDASKKASLQARARRMLDAAEGGKTAEEPEEWKTGAPIQILALSYRLRDLAAQVAEECKSMQFLGEDIKGFSRVRKGVRDDLKLAELDLHRLIDWADTIERGEDNAATLAHYRAVATSVFDF